MRIKMYFLDGVIESLKTQGLRQRNPETLRWTTDHSASSYGLGVILRGKSSDVLSGAQFAALHKALGAWIAVDSENTKRRVENALVTAATRLDDAIVITRRDPAR